MVFILLVALLNAPNLATAAVKAGAPCKVVGQSVKQDTSIFICTKSGKKLSWIAKSAVNPVQTSLGSPIALNAFNELQKAISAMGTTTNPNIRTIPTPNTDPNLVREIEGNLIYASEFFKNYLPKSQPITVWIVGSPQDLNWISASWRIAIPNQAENLIGRQDGYSAQVGMTNDGASAIIMTSSDQLTTFHEFTHAVQDQVAQGKAGLPCWVREGMAEYESNAMMGRNSEAAYRTAMVNLVRELSMISISLFKYRSAGLDYWINFFISDETRNNGTCRRNNSLLDPAYSVGGLGFQYLQGKYGREKTFEFLKNIGEDWKGICTGPSEKMMACKSWKSSFKKAFGVEPAVAYREMGAFIVNQIEWSINAKTLSESELKSEYPDSRSIPTYPALAIKDVAGSPCMKNGETKANLKCMSKDGFLFWSGLNGGGQINSGPAPQQIDDLGAPPGAPAPGRTCPNVGDRARYEKTPLICEKNSGDEGIWMIDKAPPK